MLTAFAYGHGRVCVCVPGVPAISEETEEDVLSNGSTAAAEESDHSSDSEDEGDEGYRPGGYHPVRIGECFRGSRYVVHRKLGWGHFSTVWLCWDSDGQREVALKVQKSAKNYTEAAYDEIRILEQIESGEAGDGTGKPAAESEEEPHGRTSADFSAGKLCALTLLDHFEHRGPNGTHVCMVFEVLGDNLLSLIKRFGYRGIPMTAVREIARQVLLGLDYLHTHLRIIHTDLKPENVRLEGREEVTDLVVCPISLSLSLSLCVYILLFI